VVVLGTTVLVGTTLSGRYLVAPPVLLLCLGGVIALLPGLTDIELEPEVVLLLFLPAILYWESINTSLVRAACGPGPLAAAGPGVLGAGDPPSQRWAVRVRRDAVPPGGQTPRR